MPEYPNPNYPFRDLGSTLESVFNMYSRIKEDEQRDKLNRLQIGGLEGQQRLLDVEQTSRFGAPLSQFSPQEIQQAGAGQVPGALPGYGNAVGQAPTGVGPERQSALEKLRAGLAQIRRGPELQTQQAEADIALTTQRTEALRRGQVFVDPDTGQTVQAPAGAKLLPRAHVGKGLLKTEDQLATLKLYETARDGMISGLESSDTGPIAGRLPAFTAAQQVAEGGVAAMAPVLKQLFRVSGEGVFTDRDQALLLDMVPTRRDRPEARQQKIQNIDNIVRAKLRISTDNGDDTSATGRSPISLTGAKAARLAELRAKSRR